MELDYPFPRELLIGCAKMLIRWLLSVSTVEDFATVFLTAQRLWYAWKPCLEVTEVKRVHVC